MSPVCSDVVRYPATVLCTTDLVRFKCPLLIEFKSYCVGACNREVYLLLSEMSMVFSAILYQNERSWTTSAEEWLTAWPLTSHSILLFVNDLLNWGFERRMIKWLVVGASLQVLTSYKGFIILNFIARIQVLHRVSLERTTLRCYFFADRRPVLKGDNLLRGHAAAFVRHARLAPEDILCEGRVLQVIFHSSSICVISRLLHFLLHVPHLAEIGRITWETRLRLFCPKLKLVGSSARRIPGLMGICLKKYVTIKLFP